MDPHRRTARAGGGVLWGEFEAATQAYRLHTPGGRVTSTGLGGFTTGGGYGWTSSKFGLACDNLVSAEVVLADGRVGARSQLSFDLAEVIAAAAPPVLVVIDDAHRADVSSLRLLAELAPALRAMPAAVLVTARDGDQAWQGRLDERSALLRSGLVITLPPFGEGDVADLVASLTGAPPAPDLVRVIAERSGGNPLLVVELARQVSRPGGGDAAAARVVVPEPVLVITR